MYGEHVRVTISPFSFVTLFNMAMLTQSNVFITVDLCSEYGQILSYKALSKHTMSLNIPPPNIALIFLAKPCVLWFVFYSQCPLYGIHFFERILCVI
jgi:hypothetical protein